MPKSNQKNTGKFSKKIPEIYLDYAAGASANPSSIHYSGVRAKDQLENARKEVASILGARPGEIIFTSGGTESNNLAIGGIVLAWQERARKKALPHILITNIEHPSVLETCKMLKKRNLIQVSIVPVEPNGIVDPKEIKRAIRKNTILVSAMYANNEIGTIQPIGEITKVVRRHKKQMRQKENHFSVFPLVHTDAVQAVNYLDLNVQKLGVDLLSLSGSKIEGAGGVGVLYKRKGVDLSPVFGGGDQERGFRPGTENLSEILKFTQALKSAEKMKAKEVQRLTELRDYFLNKIFGNARGSALERSLKTYGIILNGDKEHRLPNNVNITVPNIPSDLLVVELSERGMMTSAKSACESQREGGSYVIEAINSDLDPKIGGVRFSFGRGTTKRDIDRTIKSLLEILIKLKKWYD